MSLLSPTSPSPEAPSKASLSAAMIEAAAANDAAEVRRLSLTSTGFLDIPLASGESPLISALNKGRDDVALALLEAGATPEYRLAGQRHGPLECAAMNDCPATLGKLLESTGDPEISGAFYLACMRGSAKAAECLFKAAKSRPDVRLDLHYAMIQAMKARGERGLGIMEMLIQAGVDPNDRNLGTGCVPFLFFACATMNPAPVKYLLGAGAKLEAESPVEGIGTGVTPFFYAVHRGALEIASLLLEAGANPLAKTENENFANDTLTVVDCFNKSPWDALNRNAFPQESDWLQNKRNMAELVVSAMFAEKRWQGKSWDDVRATWDSLPQEMRACGQKALAALSRDFRSRHQPARAPRAASFR